MPLRLVTPFLIMLLAACSDQPETGPIAVNWDRDTCTRCRMVLSDPHFAAEIRYFPDARRSRIAKFDDIGCAVSWLQQQPWATDPKTEIWVADYRSGEWIDARTATYIQRNSTPMEYGLGALSDQVEGGMNFEQAKQQITSIERQHNRHHGHAAAEQNPQ